MKIIQALQIHFLFLTTLILLLTGCQDPITKLVNERFPPVNVNTQRQKAIDTTATALRSVYAANVAASIRLLDIEKALYTDDIKKIGVEKLELAGDEQLIRAKIVFKRVFTGVDSPDDAKLAQLLNQTKPEVEGNIDFYFGVTGSITSNDNDAAGKPLLQLQLLPALSHVELSKVKILEKIDVTASVDWLTKLITNYRDNVSGILTRHSLASISIPVAAPEPIDISQSLHIDSSGNKLQVNVSAKPVAAPVKLIAIAWLVNDNRLTTVIQFAPLDWKPQQTEPKVESSFAAIKGQINGMVRDAFGVNEINESWIGLRKELVASSMNSVVSQASACIQASGRTQQNQTSKIPMPSPDTVNCDSDRDCQSKRECSFSSNHDTRDCETCLLSRPVVCAPKVCAFGGCVGGGCTGGGCIQRGNDPVCEVAKATQNAIYVADANLRKADCDRLREMETVGCQAEVAGAKLLCETGKETLKALKRTGNLANLDLQTDIQANDVQVCLKDFSLSSGLDKMALKLGIKGNAQVDVGLKFTPLDIVGHLACQWPWTDNRKFSATIPQQDLSFDATVAIQTDGNKPQLQFSIAETEASANISPSPTEYLLTNANLTLSCSGLNFIKPLVIVATPFLPQLRGEFKQKIDKQEVLIDLPTPNAKIGEIEFGTRVEATSQALLVKVQAK